MVAPWLKALSVSHNRWTAVRRCWLQFLQRRRDTFRSQFPGEQNPHAELRDPSKAGKYWPRNRRRFLSGSASWAFFDASNLPEVTEGYRLGLRSVEIRQNCGRIEEARLERSGTFAAKYMRVREP
jgi:hypothetical protein